MYNFHKENKIYMKKIEQSIVTERNVVEWVAGQVYIKWSRKAPVKITFELILK